MAQQTERRIQNCDQNLHFKKKFSSTKQKIGRITNFWTGPVMSTSGIPLPWRPCCKPPGQAIIWTVPGLRFALSSLLALITGQALNSGWQQAPPLIWEVMNLMSPPIDGMAPDKLSQGPPGEHCHSHTLHLTLQLLPFILLSGICLWNKKKSFGILMFGHIFTQSSVSALCLTIRWFEGHCGFFEAGLISSCVNERRKCNETSPFFEFSLSLK